MSGHDRKQFQVDRIAFYSDAIIAIASTLLILEFKIPSLGRKSTWAEIMDQHSKQLLVPILGLLLSFYSISRLWIKHHALFESLINYNKRLIILNQIFLFLIMILPVSTSFMLEANNPVFLRYSFYFANLGLCNISFYLLNRTVLHRDHALHAPGVPEFQILGKKDRSLTIGLLFLSSAVLVLYTTNYFWIPFVPVFAIRLFKNLIQAGKYIYSKF